MLESHMNLGLRDGIAESVSDTISDTSTVKGIEEYMNAIEWENWDACRHLFSDNLQKMTISPWSSVKHQAWEGGYVDHLREIMYFAERLYFWMGRRFPFKLSDAFLVLFLHDLEKPWKYSWTDTEKAELNSYGDYKDFIRSKISQYGIKLTPDHENALKYVHGEWDDYDPKVRIQWPLAAFVHICDTMSARIFFDHPLQENRSVSKD